MWHGGEKEPFYHVVIHICVMCGGLSRPRSHPTHVWVCGERGDPRGVWAA